jgi:anti-anti-sigma factor
MADATPAPAGGLFEVGQDGDTLIVVPAAHLGELEYQQIEAGATEALQLLDGAAIKNVVLDLHKTGYCGSTALGLFLKLWTRVRGRGGRMAFCNVSAYEQETLRVTRLDQLWPICPSRAEALQAVRE